MTKAKTFTARLNDYAKAHHDSLDQVDLFITMLAAVDPTAMFDLTPVRGLTIVFDDGSRATLFGTETH